MCCCFSTRESFLLTWFCVHWDVQVTYEWKGMQCAYRQQGDKGKPVVLIHGFGVSSFQYRDTLKALSLSNRVFALDLVGFGSSGFSPRYSMTQRTRRSLSLLDPSVVCLQISQTQSTAWSYGEIRYDEAH